MAISKVNEEDEVYSVWKTSEGAERELLEHKLRGLLQKHARGVCYQRLSEIPQEIVNLSIYLAFKSIDGFRGEAKFSTWFQTIVTNLCNKYLKTRLQLREVPLEHWESELRSEQHVDAKIELESLISKLDTEEQKLVYWKLQGFTEEEIAALTNQTRVQVSMKWLSIRRSLGGLKPRSRRGDECEGDSHSVDVETPEEG